MKYNRICQILGIEKPVIQGPLSWLTDARLVAAVSNAGVKVAHCLAPRLAPFRSCR